ncbi:MAG: NADH-quinone oxidoreductase subunit N [Proteobacteria bacterium]|nr:NADH-quinone oxidoreductase subunit N [Pseudomonadota bacterium]
MPSLLIVSPALVLCLGGMCVLTLGLWIQSKAFVYGASLLSLAVAAILYISMIGKSSQDVFAGMLVFDPFALFFSLFSIAVVTAALLMSVGSKAIPDERRVEFNSILLALCSGLIFMVSANHFLMIYLAIETVSILSYTLAGFSREKSASVESSLKYVVYGSMASALMVFGMSLIFGITGHVDLLSIRSFFAQTPVETLPPLLWVAVLLVFAGIGYKISAAPMHMWTPDVYEGAPTPVTALFSVGPKAAGVALLVRFFVTGFSQSRGEASFEILGSFDWPKFLMYSSLFTMFMGNLAALGQVSVKRLLAYSSIAHAGYILMGTTTRTQEGLSAIVFYIILYCLMNLGAFWVTSKVEDAYGSDSLNQFKGLGRRHPFYGIAMAVFLFSLVGLPPFAGFIGKFYLFSAILKQGMYSFALLAAINSVISLYYYVKVVKVMFLEAPVGLDSVEQQNIFDCKTTVVFISLLAIPNLVLGIYWEPVMNLAQRVLGLFMGA